MPLIFVFFLFLISCDKLYLVSSVYAFDDAYRFSYTYVPEK